MQRYANPKVFLDFSAALLPWAGAVAVLSLAAGLYLALFVAPPDYQQGETVRIMFVHVPAAWMAMAAYAALTAASVTGLVWRHPVADMAAKAAAPIGAVFTALALITGSLWGKPMWGAYWVWDARLTSVLILFFQYLGYMALWAAIEDRSRAARAAALFAIVGAINIPIIRFSVDWWNTLHQPAAVIRFEQGRLSPSIDETILVPLLVMGFAYMALFVWLWLVRIRLEIFARRARSLRLQAAGEGVS